MSDNQDLTKNEKISIAMEGNQNAVKWTEETMTEILTEMGDLCKSDGCYYIGWLLDEFDLYPDWWADMTAKFHDNKTVLRRIKKVEQKLERNLVEAMLTGKVKETTGIFTLKSKHKWVDKTEVEHKVDPVQINIDLK
jgi:ribosomal protein S17E